MDFFIKLTFSKKSFRNTFTVSNSLAPDQARRFVRPDLGPNCLQRLSADDKSRHKRGKRQGPDCIHVFMYVNKEEFFWGIKNERISHRAIGGVVEILLYYIAGMR